MDGKQRPGFPPDSPLVLDATLSSRLRLARRCDSDLFSIRQPHKLIEVEHAAAFRPHFAKLDLVPAIHPMCLIPLLSDAHRFARNHAMNDLFVFGTPPASH